MSYFRYIDNTPNFLQLFIEFYNNMGIYFNERQINLIIKLFNNNRLKKIFHNVSYLNTLEDYSYCNNIISYLSYKFKYYFINNYYYKDIKIISKEMIFILNIYILIFIIEFNAEYIIFKENHNYKNKKDILNKLFLKNHMFKKICYKYIAREKYKDNLKILIKNYKYELYNNIICNLSSRYSDFNSYSFLEQTGKIENYIDIFINKYPKNYDYYDLFMFNKCYLYIIFKDIHQSMNIKFSWISLCVSISIDKNKKIKE